MKRVIATIVVFLVLVGILLIPAVFYGLDLDKGEAYEPTTIRSYKADFDVHDDGSMDVVETIRVDFPSSDRHGIFRFFDRLNSTDEHLRHRVEDVEVTYDGGDVPVDRSVEGSRYDVYRIGDPDAYVTSGVHTYEIRYHVDAVLTPGGDEVGTEAQFYWNLIPAGWQQAIDKSTLTVHLPADAADVQCVVGTEEAEEECVEDGTLSGAGGRTLAVTTGHLAPNTPVTLLAGQDVDPPEQTTVPWTPRFDTAFGTNIPLLGGIGAVALLLTALGFVLARLSHERTPRFPLMYGPPQGIGPAQASFILDETIDRRGYVASLLHAAEHGAVDLRRDGDNWTITDKAGPQGWAGLDPVTTSIAGILSGPGSSFVASKKDVTGGQRLQSEVSSFTTETRNWATSNGFLTKAGIGGLGGFLVILGFIAVVVVTILTMSDSNPLEASMVGLIPAGFAAAGIPLLKTGASTKRTETGRQLWSEVGGFKRVLSTPASQDRFDFSGRQELYTAYIPWAVAFDVADKWADKYRVETGQEPPVPAYFAGGYASGHHGAYDVDSMVSDFDSTIGSAISSYQATQSSSSSGGGGGFSGGGGGGGGGGGSW